MGLLSAPNDTGRFISATGFIFRIPPDEIDPGDPGWTGPNSFTKRQWGPRAEGR